MADMHRYKSLTMIWFKEIDCKHIPTLEKPNCLPVIRCVGQASLPISRDFRASPRVITESPEAPASQGTGFPVKRTIALLLAVGVACSLSCHKGPSTMKGKNEDVAVDRQIEKLRDIITLSSTPGEVWFEIVPLGIPGGLGPTDY